MTIGAVLHPGGSGNAVDEVVAAAKEAEAAGLGSVWLGQRFDYDAVGLAGLVGREAPGLAVGTSAVPIFGRHPILVASQAQTSQAATHGRFHLGLALGARAFVEPVFGGQCRDIEGVGLLGRGEAGGEQAAEPSLCGHHVQAGQVRRVFRSGSPGRQHRETVPDSKIGRELDQVANYESVNEAYVVEDYGCCALVENIVMGPKPE